MPELVARSQSDVSVAAPRRRPAKPKGKRAPKRTFIPAFMLAHPGRTAGCAIVAAVLTGIVMNAAFFQSARHPAPLFAGSPTVTPRASTPEVAMPLPTPRPAERSATTTTVAPPAPVAAAPLPVPAPRTSVARAEPEPRRDPISALLKEDVPEGSERVAAAQKALMKVGYVVRPDGIWGASTRKAVEQFQKERSLKVTGDLDAPTVRELRAQSRLTIP